MHLAEEVASLKEKRNAIILAHNYQVPEIQDAADFVGDSLELSRAAAKTKAGIIVFCGVDFMAETAKILNPEKKVLVPDRTAQCPMAKMLTPEHIASAKLSHPGVPLLLYINTHAECKALSDYACTSANAPEMVNAIPAKTILFGPDRNLLEYAQEKTGKRLIPIPDYGYCLTHHKILPQHIAALKRKHPAAKIVVHPECTPEVRRLADHIASTSGMLRFCKSDDAGEFIVGTEDGLCYRLEKEIPGKRFIRVGAICPNMKRNTLEKVRDSLLSLTHEIEVEKSVADRARVSIERMLQLTA